MFVTMRNEKNESICDGTLGNAKFSMSQNKSYSVTHNCFHFNEIIYNIFSKRETGNFDDTITDQKQVKDQTRKIKMSSKSK